MLASANWRIWLGLSLTGVWLALGAVHIGVHIGWGRFHNLPAGQLGNFLEGAFAPLAFLLLVIGCFLQTTAPPELADPAVTGIHVNM